MNQPARAVVQHRTKENLQEPGLFRDVWCSFWFLIVAFSGVTFVLSPKTHNTFGALYIYTTASSLFHSPPALKLETP